MRLSEPAPERNVWLTIPNVLTAMRLISIVPFVLLAVQGRDRAALLLFILAGLTDALDGAIARLYGQASKVGRMLDPVADKLFTGASFVTLSAFRGGLSSIPAWVMVAVLLRDILILSGSVIVYRTSRNSSFQPSLYGKLNTLLEIGIVVCFLAQSDFPILAPVLPVAYVLLLLSLLVSTGDYLRTGIRMTRESAATSK